MTFCNLKVLTLSDKDRWYDELAEANHSVYHTWDYCSALTSQYPAGIKLYVHQYNAIKQVATFTERSKTEGFIDLFTPYGYGGIAYTGSDAGQLDALQLFVNSLREEGAVSCYAMGHPALKGSQRILDLFPATRSVFLLNLCLQPEEILGGMAKGHRYEIRRSQKLVESGGIEVSIETDSALSDLHQLLQITNERVGASKVYEFNVATLKNLLMMPQSTLVTARENKELVAACLFLSNAQTAEYFLSVSTSSGKSHTRFLIWRAILHLLNHGVTKLNLGGGIEEGDDLHFFKERFGGERLFVPVVKQIIDYKKFNFLNTEFKSLDKRGEFFPPYWSSP